MPPTPSFLVTNLADPVSSLFRIPSLFLTLSTIFSFHHHFSLSLDDNIPYSLPNNSFDTATFFAYLVGIYRFVLLTASDLLELLLHFYTPPTTSLGRYVAVAFVDFLSLPFLIAASFLISFSSGPGNESSRECVELFGAIVIFRVFSIVRTYLFYFSIMRYEGWDGEMVPQPGMARGGW